MTYPMAGDPDACERAFQLANDKYWDNDDDQDGEHPGELETVAIAGFLKRRMARSGHTVEIEHLGVSQ